MTEDDRIDGLMIVVLWILAYPIGVVVHEAGHLVAGELLGFKPRVLMVGAGRTIARWQIGRVWFILRSIPFSGVVLLPAWVGRPVATITFLAGGIAANLLVCGFGLLVMPDTMSIVSDLGIALVCSQLTLVFMACWPTSVVISGRHLRSDGLQIAHVLTGKREDWVERVRDTLLRPFAAAGAALPPPSRHFGEIAFQLGRLDRLDERWAARETQADMRQLLLEPDMTPAERAYVLTFLCGNEIAFGDTGTSGSDLDRWSREALDLMPSSRTRITRGGSLLTLGRSEEAQALLMPLAGMALSEIDAFYGRMFLGRAAAALGQFADARRWFADARALPIANVDHAPQILARQEALAAIPPGRSRSGIPDIGGRALRGELSA